jgi:hypothetical protein
MRLSPSLLTGLVLTISSTAQSASGAETSDNAQPESPIRLAGANGHDSVGGLMPLPLWPPLVTTRGPVTVR